ncbi:adrenodoxin-like [Liolophura sinensis]|uniref:adrenodoxin-like n=1 Tax=Liolophura sinensis TaxID=3198878 RepID=UPI003158CC31
MGDNPCTLERLYDHVTSLQYNMAALARRLFISTVRIPWFAVSRTKCTSSHQLLAPPRFLRQSLTKKEHFSSTVPRLKKETVNIYFVTADGEKLAAKAKLGDNLLDVIIENDLDIDGFGACEGTLACSTCHLIFKPEQFEKIPDKPTDEELDMLDLAFGLEDTSRLGCQVCVTKDMEGWEIKVPVGVADARNV